MSRFSKDSKFRLRDFSRRKAYCPDSVFIHVGLGYEYIPHHPFSDENRLLEKLNLQPRECKSVGAWWNMKTDISLIEVTSNKHNARLNPGLYAGWHKEKKRIFIPSSNYRRRYGFES